MPTPAQLLADAAAAIASTTGATRLSSDYRDDLERIPAGALRFALRGGPRAIDAADANVSYVVEQLELELKHQLASPANERAYTEGALQTHLATLIAPSFWFGLASAYEVVEDPTYAITREGALIIATIRTAVSIRP
jgi:hypothetical protein